MRAAKPAGSRTMRALFYCAALSQCLWTAGCGRYEDFTLPSPPGEYRKVSILWEVRPEPVMGRGEEGSWDAVDTLNPSVVVREGAYFNFYSGFDGKTWHTGLATSGDGLQWTRRGKVLSPDPATWEGDYIAANGAALWRNGEFLYWYQAGGRRPQIGLARSPNGSVWTRLAQPVLPAGPRGSWDERDTADPYVLEAGGNLFMFYLGTDRARRQRLGVARSDDGVHWRKLRSNPVLELGAPGSFDETGLGEPAVWASHGRYWMLYTARDPQEVRRLGLASSRDGVRWQRVSEGPALEGLHAWNEKVVCDPTVEVRGNTVRVWYGGGNAARPDENVNGQIGLAVMRIQPEN